MLPKTHSKNPNRFADSGTQKYPKSGNAKNKCHIFDATLRLFEKSRTSRRLPTAMQPIFRQLHRVGGGTQNRFRKQSTFQQDTQTRDKKQALKTWPRTTIQPLPDTTCECCEKKSLGSFSPCCYHVTRNPFKEPRSFCRFGHPIIP